VGKDSGPGFIKANVVNCDARADWIRKRRGSEFLGASFAQSGRVQSTNFKNIIIRIFVSFVIEGLEFSPLAQIGADPELLRQYINNDVHHEGTKDTKDLGINSL
jgi:hypothetical protein